MNGRYLLDTNVVIAFFADEDAVVKRMAGASEVFLPSVVLGELVYGAAKSGRANENLRRVTEFANSVTILGVGKATAEAYGAIKDGLRRRGKAIPENDIWIAAVAQEYGLVLATRDEHFREVQGLQIEAW